MTLPSADHGQLFLIFDIPMGIKISDLSSTGLLDCRINNLGGKRIPYILHIRDRKNKRTIVKANIKIVT